MPKVHLEVPFSEKDEAKALGARWDGSAKVWYVPEGLDTIAFERWLPDAPSINVAADRYFIAETDKSCWKCSETTMVYAILLPIGHETLDFDEDEEEVWFRNEDTTILHYVTNLPPSVAARMNAYAPGYRPDFSKTTESTYWMNHCASCGMKQGDFDMHCEPAGAFFPMNEQSARQIALHEIHEDFSCSASASYGENFFDFMRRA